MASSIPSPESVAGILDDEFEDVLQYGEMISGIWCCRETAAFLSRASAFEHEFLENVGRWTEGEWKFAWRGIVVAHESTVPIGCFRIQTTHKGVPKSYIIGVGRERRRVETNTGLWKCPRCETIWRLGHPTTLFPRAYRPSCWFCDPEKAPSWFQEEMAAEKRRKDWYVTARFTQVDQVIDAEKIKVWKRLFEDGRKEFLVRVYGRFEVEVKESDEEE